MILHLPINSARDHVSNLASVLSIYLQSPTRKKGEEKFEFEFLGGKEKKFKTERKKRLGYLSLESYVWFSENKIGTMSKRKRTTSSARKGVDPSGSGPIPKGLKSEGTVVQDEGLTEYELHRLEM